VIGVATQFFLAGAGAFGAASYSAHKAIGDAVALAALLALLLSLAARRYVLPCLVLAVAAVVQVVLGGLGTSSSSWFGAVHGLNALVVLGTAGNLVRRTSARSFKVA